MLPLHPFYPLIIFAAPVMQRPPCPLKFLRQNSKADKYYDPSWAWIWNHNDTRDKYNATDDSD